MASTDLAKKTASTELTAFDYGEDAGSGFENQTAADYSIPFLGVLQQMSPQVKDPDDGGIAGARPGMLLNTVTEELYSAKEGLQFVPAHTEHVFVEWVPRESGGGFVAVHQINSDVVKRAKANAREYGKYRTDAGNDLVETFYVYGITCDDRDAGEMLVIAFTSTKIKVYKRWNTKIGMFQIKTGDGRKVRPPLFAHRVKLTTSKEKNNKGEFYNLAINPAETDLTASLLSPDDPRFMAAKECKRMVESGMARAAYDSQDNAGGGGGSGADDEVPF